MREILFRGLDLDSNWVEGSLLTQEKVWIATGSKMKQNDIHTIWREVKPETIGQYTGLKDSNGVKVFEGDKFDDIDADDEGSYFVIEYCEVKARFIAMLYGYGEYINENGGEELNTYISALDDCILDPEDLLDQEIIGNIHSEAKG